MLVLLLGYIAIGYSGLLAPSDITPSTDISENLPPQDDPRTDSRPASNSPMALSMESPNDMMHGSSYDSIAPHTLPLDTDSIPADSAGGDFLSESPHPGYGRPFDQSPRQFGQLPSMSSRNSVSPDGNLDPHRALAADAPGVAIIEDVASNHGNTPIEVNTPSGIANSEENRRSPGTISGIALMHDEQAIGTGWQMANTIIEPNVLYAAPGGFQPEFQLRNGIVIQILDGARISFHRDRNDEESGGSWEIPTLVVEEGRVVITGNRQTGFVAPVRHGAAQAETIRTNTAKVRLQFDTVQWTYDPGIRGTPIDQLHPSARSGSLTLLHPESRIEVDVHLETVERQPELNRMVNRCRLLIAPAIRSAVVWENPANEQGITIPDHPVTIEVMPNDQRGDILANGIPTNAFNPELPLDRQTAAAFAQKISQASNLSEILKTIARDENEPPVFNAIATNWLVITQQFELLQPGSAMIRRANPLFR